MNNCSFLDAVKLFFTRAFDFKGRSRRKEFWYIYLINLILSLPLIVGTIWLSATTMSMMNDPAALEGTLSSNETFFEFYGIYSGFMMIYGLITFIPSLSLTVRRLHDTNHHWYFMLINLLAIIPLVGWIATIYFLMVLAEDGDQNTNEWGPSPKYIAE